MAVSRKDRMILRGLPEQQVDTIAHWTRLNGIGRGRPRTGVEGRPVRLRDEEADCPASRLQRDGCSGRLKPTA